MAGEVNGMRDTERERWEIEVCLTCKWQVDSYGECGCDEDAPGGESTLIEVVPADQLRGAVSLIDALDSYVGHRPDCSALSGAPECSCGFDDLYTRVRAVVRGGQ